MLKGAFIINANIPAYQNILGTLPDSSYHAYLIALDWSKNIQPAPAILSFSAPALKYISPQDTGDTLTFRFQSSNTNIVYLRGEFNKWEISYPMKKVSPDMWEISLEKTLLKKYTRYSFCVHPMGNYDWYSDLMNPSNVIRYGYVNSLMWW